MKYLPIFLLGLALSTAHAQLRPRSFEAWDIFLYQPDNVLQERLSGSVRGLTDYMKQLMSTCEASFASPPIQETLNIIVAVRPGKRSRVWFVSSRPNNTPQRQALRRKLEAITPCEVRGGPVAFALSYKVAGGDGKRLKNPPMPKEWEDAAKAKGKALLIPDGILDIVWPAHK